MAEKRRFVRDDYKTSPTCEVLGRQVAIVRSKAHANLPKLSPIVYDTRVHVGMRPHREFGTPDARKAALQGIDQLSIDATERAYRRARDDATQREHDSGTKKSIR
jgi:hypothetical protein